MRFSDDFLEVLGAWQRGWRENQDVRLELAEKLKKATKELSDEFRTVDEVCYRKRFLHHGEFFEIIMVDEKDEGLVSWTIDRQYAERFKGLYKPDAVSGAIFEHKPVKGEVVVNICALWDSDDFVNAATAYKVKNGKNADAIFYFKAVQGEVILSSPLKGSEIIALTGASSPFDELCDRLNIPQENRDGYFKQLVDLGTCPEELRYTSKEGTQRVIQNVIKIVEDKIASAVHKTTANS